MKQIHLNQAAKLSEQLGPPLNANEYDIQLITSKSELHNCKNDILLLLLKSNNSSYLQDPNYILAECERNTAKTPFYITIREDNRLVFIVNGIIERKPFYLSFSVKKLRISYARFLTLHKKSFFGGDPHSEQDLFRLSFKILTSCNTIYDIINLEEIETDSLLWRYLSTDPDKPSCFLFSPISIKKETTSFHKLYDNYENWYRSLRAKTRKKISWEKNRFNRRAEQPIELHRITEKEDVAAFINKAEEIYSASWQGKIFSTDRDPTEKKIKFCTRLAEHGWLRSYLLECNGKPIAYELSIQYGHECTFLERAYRQDMRRLAPGNYLTYYIIEDCYQHAPPDTINFGFGENQFKTRLRTDTKESQHAYLTTPGKWRMYVRCQQLLTFAEKNIAILLKRLQIDQKVRNFLKQKNKK